MRGWLGDLGWSLLLAVLGLGLCGAAAWSIVTVADALGWP